MYFDFSEEQEMLREQVQRMLRERCPTTVVRAVLESDSTLDQTVWQSLVEMGLPGVATPEAYGGAGAGYLELCVIAEELGRSLAPVPFSSTVYLGTEAFLLAGSEDQKLQWLPKLASGELLAALALAEGKGSASYSKMTSRSTVIDGLQCTLQGRKASVMDGMAADIAIVAAKDDQEIIGLYLVDLNQAGVKREIEPSLDDSRPLAVIEFEGAVAERLASADGEALQTLLDRAAVLFAFEQIGGAQAALDMGVAYAKERKAFGRPIGSFQAIKHKLADMYAELEIARSNCYYAAWALANNNEQLPVAAATARISASRAYFNCATENIQVHGGMGFTWELDAHLHYRRAKVMSLIIGNEMRWQERLVCLLEQQEKKAS
jgi:acyl-CoA dehydrogenase